MGGTPYLIIFLVCGLFLWAKGGGIIELRKSLNELGPHAAISTARRFVLAVTGVLLLVYLFNLMFWTFNNHDDYQAYMVFPQRILTAGAARHSRHGQDPGGLRR